MGGLIWLFVIVVPAHCITVISRAIEGRAQSAKVGKREEESRPEKEREKGMEGGIGKRGGGTSNHLYLAGRRAVRRLRGSRVTEKSRIRPRISTPPIGNHFFLN
jgi:hypothetical protein